MYKILEKLLTPNKYSRTQAPLKGVLGVVVHYVANTKTSALLNRNFFENRKLGTTDYGAAHYIVDLNGDVIRCIPDNEVAYHAGAKVYKPMVVKDLHNAPNSYTLGIECTHIKNSGEMSPETYNTTLELCVDLCKKYKLNPLTQLFIHYEITGKDCHKWFVSNPAEWVKFKNLVNSKMNGVTAEVKKEEVKSEKIVLDDKAWNDSATGKNA